MRKRIFTSTIAAVALFAVVGLVAALAIAWPNLARAHSGEASLTALTVTVGGVPHALSPAFSSTVYSYTVRMSADNVAQVTVTGTPDGDGTVTAAQPVTVPAVGSRRLNVVVSHTDSGTTTRQTYTVLMIREGTVETDRAALMALYNSTDGANWTDNTNWGSTEPLGTWFGVTTNTDGRVTDGRVSNLYLPGAGCGGNELQRHGWEPAGCFGQPRRLVFSEFV